MLNKYIQFFRGLAKAHKMIAHNPDTESKDYMGTDRSAFTIFNSDDVLRNVRTNLSPGPTLHLHIYSSNIMYNGTVKANREGGFMVTAKPGSNAIADENITYEKCERVALGLIAKLQHIFANDRCSLPFIIDVAKIQMVPVGPIWDDRFGWYLTFPLLPVNLEPDFDLYIAEDFDEEIMRVFSAEFSLEFA